MGPLMRSAVSLPIFKKNILKTFRPNKKDIFGIHDPRGIKFLFQLRVGLSALKNHKYNHHFLDTPSDRCLCNGDVETTQHYLLKCSYFSCHRRILFESVNPVLSNHNLRQVNDDILIKILLYGHDSLSLHENGVILQATIKFMKDSGRL